MYSARHDKGGVFMELIKSIISKYNNMETKSKIKLVQLLVVIILIFIVCVLLNSIEKSITYYPFTLFGEPLNKTYTLQLETNATCYETIDFVSLSNEVLNSINDETATLSTFMDLYDKANSIRNKSYEILIPEEACGIEFENISIYAWKTEWQSWLSWIFQIEPAKNYIVLLKVDEKYIKIESADMNLSMKAGVECGIVKH